MMSRTNSAWSLLTVVSIVSLNLDNLRRINDKANRDRSSDGLIECCNRYRLLCGDGCVGTARSTDTVCKCGREATRGPCRETDWLSRIFRHGYGYTTRNASGAG